MPRDWLFTAGEAPLSKMLIEPSESSRGSCCQAVLVAGAILKLLRLPPRRHEIRPPRASRSYTAHVLRAEISRLLSASRLTEFRCRKSNGELGVDLRACS